MATITWNGSTTSWNTPSNWSPAQVPTSIDDVIFNGLSVQDCTCDVPIDIASLTAELAYSGRLDLANVGYSHAVSGDVILDGAGTFDLGNSIITIGGDFDCSDMALAGETGNEVVLTKPSAGVLNFSGRTLRRLTVSGSYTMSDGSTYHNAWGPISIPGTLSVSSGTTLAGLGAVSIDVSNGELSGNGTLRCTGNGWSITGADTGTLNISITARQSFTLNAGTYGGNISATQDNSSNDRTITINGDVTFGGNFTMSCDRASRTYTFDNSGNHNLAFQGNLWIRETAGDVAWQAGTGTISFTGTNDQTLTTPAGWTERLEAISYDKSAGSLTLVNDLYCNALTAEAGSAGTLDFSSGSHNILGNATFAGGGTVDLGSATITCGGDFHAANQGTFIAATATIRQTATSRLTPGDFADINTLIVDVGATVTLASNGVNITALCDVNGTLQCSEFWYNFYISSGGDLQVSGAIQSLRLYVYGTWSAIGTTSNLDHVYAYDGGDITGSGTINGPLTIVAQNWFTATTILPATLTVNGAFTVSQGTGGGVLTVDLNTNNTSLTLYGDMSIDVVDNDLVWQAGTGTISFTGANDQTLTTPAGWTERLEAISYDKSAGSLTLVNDLYCNALTVEFGSAGTLDFSSGSHNILGNAIFDGSGTVNCGTATITINGDFDNRDQATWGRGTSTIVLDGTAKTIIGNSANLLYALTVSGTYTLSADTTTYLGIWQGGGSITGTLTLSAQLFCGNGSLSVSGTIDGPGELFFQQATFSSMTGTCAPGTVTTARDFTFTATGTFGGDWTFRRLDSIRTLTAGAGTRTFTGNVTFWDQNGTYTVDNSADPSWVFQGGVTFNEGGTLTWQAGTGTISFSGTNDQTLTTPAGWTERLEAISYDKSAGSLTLVNDLYCNALTVESGSAGTLDFGSGSHTVDSLGNITFAGGGTVNLGNALIACGGDFHNLSQNTTNAGTSTTTMSGGNSSLSVYTLYDVVISGGITLGWNLNCTDLTVTGTLTINNPRSVSVSGDTVVSTGTITGSGYFYVVEFGVSITGGGNWTLANNESRYNTTINAGTYGGSWSLLNGPVGGSRSLTIGGNIVWSGAVTIDANQGAATFTIDNIGNHDLVFQGNLTLSESAGTLVWSAGTGTISFTAGNPQTVTAPAAWAQVLEDITVNKTNTLTLASNLATESFTGTSGTMDLGGNTLTSSGAVAVNNPFNFAPAQATSSVAVQGGTLALNGANGAQLIIDDIDFAMSAGVTGAATYADVTNSTATGDADIDATDGTSNDLGGNTGWDFGAVAPVPVIDDPGAQTGEVGVAFNLQMTASNNPTSWSAVGLPAGLGIDNTGVISGTPTTAQVVTASITATNASGDSAPQDVEFTIQIGTDITATNPYGSDAISFTWTVNPPATQSATVRTSMISSPQILGSDWAAINQWDVPDDTVGVEALQWIGFRIIDAGTYVLDALILCDLSPVIASWVERDNPTGEVVFINAPYNPVSGPVDRIELPTLTRQFQSGDEVGIGVKATESGSHIFNLLEGSWLRIATT